jgi:[acyl-carrier-protein] S-malonyltransferase
MQTALPQGRGTMAALLGLDLRTVKEICERASTSHEIVVPANLNGPGQTVVAGHNDAVRRAIALAGEHGAKSIELKVSAPFHSPLMQPVRDAMASVLGGIEIGPLEFGVISNVTAEVNRDSKRVVPLLLEQITAPVRWEESMAKLAAIGIDHAIEFGCGRMLAGLMRRIDKSVNVMACEDLKSLKNVGAALAKG